MARTRIKRSYTRDYVVALQAGDVTSETILVHAPHPENAAREWCNEFGERFSRVLRHAQHIPTTVLRPPALKVQARKQSRRVHTYPLIATSDTLLLLMDVREACKSSLASLERGLAANEKEFFDAEDEDRRIELRAERFKLVQKKAELSMQLAALPGADHG